MKATESFDFKEIKQIYRNTTTDLYEAIGSDGKKCIIKQLSDSASGKGSRIKFLNEYDILKDIDSLLIRKIYGSGQVNGRTVVILEYIHEKI